MPVQDDIEIGERDNQSSADPSRSGTTIRARAEEAKRLYHNTLRSMFGEDLTREIMSNIIKWENGE